MEVLAGQVVIEEFWNLAIYELAIYEGALELDLPGWRTLTF